MASEKHVQAEINAYFYLFMLFIYSIFDLHFLISGEGFSLRALALLQDLGPPSQPSLVLQLYFNLSSGYVTPRFYPQ